ncbi:MAG: thiamine biosynthesis protein ThiS [Phycisphaerae bacterium]|jgi:thiamine biosynthesis protein ThiS|nr:thiamine biosynthesis protein ThiS [Phycisphaerae bacterium]|tara:strand:- start:1096 stop:1350 length:255 start_codon:yes stop_codon:yes gene_type:complete
MVDTPFIAFAVNHLGTIRRMLTVNGKSKEFVGEITLQELLVQLELEKTLCAIEVNNSLVPHKLRNEYTLQDGDNVEIVSLVGGG